MQLLNLELKELKEKYNGRHGFVFQGSSTCNAKYCEVIANLVKDNGFTQSLPECFIRLDHKTYAFVYPKDSSFNSGDFYNVASKLSMMGHFQIDILLSFLQKN